MFQSLKRFGRAASLATLALALAPRVRINGISPGLILRSGDQTEDDVIGNQQAGIHDFLRLHSQGRSGPYRRSQHVAGRNLRNAEFVGYGLRLGSFAGARRPQKDDSHNNHSRVKNK